MTATLDRLRAFADECRRRGLTDEQALAAAERELGLHAVECPVCNGPGCATCDGEGVVFGLGEAGKA